MSRNEIERMRAEIAELKDALQVSEFTIEQAADGSWPKYDPKWRFKEIVVHQGPTGDWPPYNDKLHKHCDVIIEALSFGHDKVLIQWPPYGPGPKGPVATRAEWEAMQRAKGLDPYDFQAARAAATPGPTNHFSPDPLAQRARKHAMITGQQVPVDPERLDRS